MYGVNNIAPHDANDDLLLRGASDKNLPCKRGGHFAPRCLDRIWSTCQAEGLIRVYLTYFTYPYPHSFSFLLFSFSGSQRHSNHTSWSNMSPSLNTPTSGSSKDEGGGVSPQNKGSWSSFLKVHLARSK